MLGKPIRRPVDDHDRVLAAARRVVPAYKDAGIIGELWLPLEHEASRLFIVVNLQPAAEDAQAKVSHEFTQTRLVVRGRIRLESTGQNPQLRLEAQSAVKPDASAIKILAVRVDADEKWLAKAGLHAIRYGRGQSSAVDLAGVEGGRSRRAGAR